MRLQSSRNGLSVTAAMDSKTGRKSMRYIPISKLGIMSALVKSNHYKTPSSRRINRPMCFARTGGTAFPISLQVNSTLCSGKNT